MSMQIAIQACQAASAAVAAYDAFIFAGVGQPFDDARADALAIEAAVACQAAAAAGAAAGCSPQWDLDLAAFFFQIGS